MQTDLVSTILPGLLSSPKYVPQWYTYDKLGSELFDRVTNENPDYHLYRVEMSLLKEHTDKIIDNFDETSVFAELGAGNSSKMHRLIEAILKKEGSLRFIPIDISKEYVEESAKNLIKLFPLLDVQPFVGHYLDGMVHVKSLQGSKLLVFLGSSFSSIPEAQMLPFLETIRDAIEERIGKTIDLEEGEVIHINSPGKTSIKWDWKQFEKLAKAAGLTTEQIWTDQDNLFTLGLMKADLQ
ncbi:histidine N-alpha-methyltransferase-like isoform X2 [Ptychodera flava]|uniref:histidine N-alpha-methyltransferase-like isoform X2 n=1 Tax=Ptychodera flava TaxID=63121 RepID=UPI00396A894A